MNRIPVCRLPAIPYLGCAAAFLVIGARQPAFVGVGCAFLGLALAMLRRNPTP